MARCTLGLKSSKLEIKRLDCCSYSVSVSVQSRVSLVEQLFRSCFTSVPEISSAQKPPLSCICSPAAAGLQPYSLQALVRLDGPGLRLALALASASPSSFYGGNRRSLRPCDKSSDCLWAKLHLELRKAQLYHKKMFPVWQKS